MALEGRTALITGAGSGIGRAIALEASRRGMILALVGRRAEPLAGDASQPRPQCDLPGHCRRCHLSCGARPHPRAGSPASGAVSTCSSTMPAFVAAGPLVETEDAPLQRLMATNLLAPFAMIRDLLPLAPRRLAGARGEYRLPARRHRDAALRRLFRFEVRPARPFRRAEARAEPLGIGVTYAAPRGARTEATQAIARYVEPLDMPLDAPETIARQVWDAVARGKDAVLSPRPRAALPARRAAVPVGRRSRAARRASRRAAAAGSSRRPPRGRGDGTRKAVAAIGGGRGRELTPMQGGTDEVARHAVRSSPLSRSPAPRREQWRPAARRRWMPSSGRSKLEWARITYQVTDGDEKEKDLHVLADTAAAIATPQSRSRRAAHLGRHHRQLRGAVCRVPSSALGFAKQARELFEKAGRLDYRALDGAVPTSLGALYYMVPGFPLGFGDNGKARRYLEQGVEISPRRPRFEFLLWRFPLSHRRL